MMKLASTLLVCFAALSAACGPGPVGRPGPVVNTQPNKVGGTIAGIVKTADSAVAVPGRKVSVINVATGARHDTTTGANGGYTIQVPEGTYRFEIELRGSEILAKQPEPTHVGNSDLDTSRDFVITMRASGAS
jgi:Carboxypeptidase regulatory-like domain